ncbi:MAG: YhbY family RNA-binding protein, partial [Caldimonas sp.]
MPSLFLTPAERKQKRADAHHLHPVVAIGNDGATEAVRREIDAALDAHGLVKIRVFSDDRAAREALLGELSAAFGAAPVQHIGKLLVLWRPPVEKAKVEKEDRMPGPKVVKVLKF